jgi:hypothetical protein
MQNELGVHEMGRYIVSVKNPDYLWPGNAPIGNPAAYPKSIQEKFKGLRWIPLIPELLDYDNTQLLVIGEAVNPTEKPAEAVSDQKDNWAKTTSAGGDEQGTQVGNITTLSKWSNNIGLDP